VATLYLVANISYLRVLSIPAMAASHHVASDAVQAVSSGGARWLTAAMAISAFGALQGVVLAGPRVPYAMARDRLFFRFAAHLHPRFRTPVYALLFQGGVGAVLAVTGTFEGLFSLYEFAVWIFFALAAVALFKLRQGRPVSPGRFRSYLHPWSSMLFVLVALALTVSMLLANPLGSIAGLVVILAGVPFYFHWSKYRGHLPIGD
jgi:APA family basic amino acid/polyamine antiporter